jgi:alkylated DNA nucleotide flippase Atl1
VAIERVLWAAASIPPGRVATYGDIGRAVGVTPRQVGWIMARFGSEVPWWRVVSAQGRLPADLLARAVAHWREEGIAVQRSGEGCVLSAHRVEPGWLESED